MLGTLHQVGKMKQAHVHTGPYTHSLVAPVASLPSSSSSEQLYLVLDSFWCSVRLGEQRMALTHMDAVLQGNSLMPTGPTAPLP